MAASREIKTLSLQKVEPNQPWGFRIVGGTDEALILKVDKVCVNITNQICATNFKLQEAAAHCSLIKLVRVIRSSILDRSFRILKCK